MPRDRQSASGAGSQRTGDLPGPLRQRRLFQPMKQAGFHLSRDRQLVGIRSSRHGKSVSGAGALEVFEQPMEGGWRCADLAAAKPAGNRRAGRQCFKISTNFHTGWSRRGAPSPISIGDAQKCASGPARRDGAFSILILDCLILGKSLVEALESRIRNGGIHLQAVERRLVGCRSSRAHPTSTSAMRRSAGSSRR